MPFPPPAQRPPQPPMPPPMPPQAGGPPPPGPMPPQMGAPPPPMPPPHMAPDQMPPGEPEQQPEDTISADDIAVLQKAPEAVDVFKKMFPELAETLDDMLAPDEGEGGPDEPDDNRGPDEPRYTMPRPQTRLGQM